jgi:hypothetical protein
VWQAGLIVEGREYQESLDAIDGVAEGSDRGAQWVGQGYRIGMGIEIFVQGQGHRRDTDEGIGRENAAHGRMVIPRPEIIRLRCRLIPLTGKEIGRLCRAGMYIKLRLSS